VHPYPHVYLASARADSTGQVPVTSPDLPGIDTGPPPQFDGPPGCWSPETLLTASLADCFILTFRAVSRASRFEWKQLECEVEGVLERVDGVAQFTKFTTTARLTVAPGTDVAKAQTLLEKSEHSCLIANSMRGSRSLRSTVLTA